MTKPAWLFELETNGYAIVPNAVPKEACAEFRAEALNWLESFPWGFKRDDRSTWTSEHLPYGFTGGLYNRYSINHEAFVWKIRAQPGVIKAFADVWGTDDLIASFDGMNVTLPINADTGRTDLKPTMPWPHMDQNPRRAGIFEMAQGIVNLGACGPNDGGLVVMKASHKLHQRHFDETDGFKAEQDRGVNENGYQFTREDHEWYRKHGCEEVKVCANEGDLILWDSRLMHWNSSPEGDQIRFATYVCYCPRSKMSDEMLAKKREIFEARKGTTHWPNMNIVPIEQNERWDCVPHRPDGSVDPANRFRPFKEPEVTPEVLMLVGVRP